MRNNLIETHTQVIEMLKEKKVMIKSKLSRIRRKFYLHHDANTALIYEKEVRKYINKFKPKRREKQKWERRIFQTCNDIIQPVSENVDKSDMASGVTKLPDQAPPDDGGDKVEISEDEEESLFFPEIP